MKKFAAALATIALTVLAASAETGMRAGMLTCDVAPGIGFLIGSQKTVDCDFESVLGWRESYTGRITRIGLDVGYTSGGTLAWAVYAPSQRGAGALAGIYGGASAEATVGVGAGANVLVGGFKRSISLQPISVGTQQGLDLALAVSGLQLELMR